MAGPDVPVALREDGISYSVFTGCLAPERSLGGVGLGSRKVGLFEVWMWVLKASFALERAGM